MRLCVLSSGDVADDLVRDVARPGLGGLKPPNVILAPHPNEFQPMKYPGLVKSARKDRPVDREKLINTSAERLDRRIQFS